MTCKNDLRKVKFSVLQNEVTTSPTNTGQRAFANFRIFISERVNNTGVNILLSIHLTFYVLRAVAHALSNTACTQQRSVHCKAQIPLGPPRHVTSRHAI